MKIVTETEFERDEQGNVIKETVISYNIDDTDRCDGCPCEEEYCDGNCVEEDKACQNYVEEISIPADCVEEVWVPGIREYLMGVLGTVTALCIIKKLFKA